jgi:hypothetical protein
MDMAKVKNVEKKIWDIEGFDVRIKFNGRDLRSDKQGLPQYNSKKASRNNWTVTEWKKKKFFLLYPGYDVDVLDGDGNVVTGQTTLASVRDSYLEDEE